MKNTWIAILMILSFVIFGCSKEQDPILYTITSSATSGGTINPCGVTNVNTADSVIYIIKPNKYYSIKSIKVDGIEQPIFNTYKFKNVFENREIKVESIPMITKDQFICWSH